jgi:SAM-dependent methyltransferase
VNTEATPGIIAWTAGISCCNPRWESAYSRFETRAGEVDKFTRRLRAFGVESWPRDLRIVELFCGRGSSLEAWQRLGFHRLEGVDLSPELLTQYHGPAQLYCGDCRDLQLPNESTDVVAVQGGLHHLPHWPGDLERTLREIHRILKPGGHVLLVEPWSTPFLHAAHAACGSRVLRGLWGKLDALAIMIEEESETYHRWLDHPQIIRDRVRQWFDPAQETVSWGKWQFLGTSRRLTRSDQQPDT